MNLLDDNTLIQLYEKAFKSQLDQDFVEMILNEMNRRKLKYVILTVEE